MSIIYFDCPKCGVKSKNRCLYCEAKYTFMHVCPAWVRKLGITNLTLWNIIEKAMPLSSSARFDYLDSLYRNIEPTDKTLTTDEVFIIRKVLETWDEMAGQPR